MKIKISELQKYLESLKNAATIIDVLSYRINNGGEQKYNAFINLICGKELDIKNVDKEAILECLRIAKEVMEQKIQNVQDNEVEI